MNDPDLRYAVANSVVAKADDPERSAVLRTISARAGALLIIIQTQPIICPNPLPVTPVAIVAYYYRTRE